MSTIKRREDVAAVYELSAQIARLLMNRPPAVSGAVLANLVGAWLAGFEPERRPNMFSYWADHMMKLMGAHSLTKVDAEVPAPSIAPEATP